LQSHHAIKYWRHGRHIELSQRSLQDYLTRMAQRNRLAAQNHGPDWRPPVELDVSCIHWTPSTKANKPEPYPVKLWWKCGGVPNLQNQRVAYLEEASRQYYMARTAGRDFQDRMLEEHVPPSSILTHDKYKNLFTMVLEEPEEGLGSQIMMRMNCELFNDLEWAQDDFENTLSRSTAGVRGILDIIYR
uniref:RNA-directed RNA polymerase n=1 Tax=Schistocephalus solidus TaxID=70667 RepID=A0A183TSA3_SCHSO